MQFTDDELKELIEAVQLDTGTLVTLEEAGWLYMSCCRDRCLRAVLVDRFRRLIPGGHDQKPPLALG